MITFDRQYTTIDKTGWGPGAWNEEVDKAQWVDATTDLDCLIKRSSTSGILCGYVGVPTSHPWHEKMYTDIEDEIDVHGGLTYSGLCDETDDESTGICHVPLPGRDPHVKWFGFDCNHFWDFAPGLTVYMKSFYVIEYYPVSSGGYKDIEYVGHECTALAMQLAALGVSQ